MKRSELTSKAMSDMGWRATDRNNLPMKLESRPLPERDFEFMFYFDIQESVYSDGFIRLINQLEDISLKFEYLGSYSE